MCAVEVCGAAIGTERLILRAPVAADAPVMVELANDPRVAGNVARLPFPYTQAHAEEGLAQIAAYDPRREVAFAIEHRHFGFIGMLSFHERQPRRPEVGYWVGRPFWGRGYATEALEASLRWAKGDWRRNVVWAGHFADNPASGQVLCKAGFLYTGDVEPRECLARGQTVPSRMMVWLA